MVTTPEQLEGPDRMAEARLAIDAGMREAIAGSPVGSVRRILLYIVSGTCVVALGAMGPSAAATAGLAIVALFLLALTDKLA